MTQTSLFIYFFAVSFFCFGQENMPVRWQFQSEIVGHQEAVLIFKAQLAPGWHLYSQFVGDGGPVPTQFTYEGSDAYILKGGTKEKGTPIKFYDSIYDMQITQYSGSITFLQKIVLNQSTATVQGRIEYLTCNNQVCIPDRLDFSIEAGEK